MFNRLLVCPLTVHRQDVKTDAKLNKQGTLGGMKFGDVDWQNEDFQTTVAIFVKRGNDL